MVLLLRDHLPHTTGMTPDCGAPNSDYEPMDKCGKGFLDDLRGRCGVITNWGCVTGNSISESRHEGVRPHIGSALDTSA